MLRRLAAGGLAGTALALAGCGGGDPQPAGAPGQETRLLDALESIGGAEAFTGTGYGWIDVEALEPADLTWAARALGPGGEALVREPQQPAGLGVAVSGARQLVSLSGSYLFGARIDGVETQAAAPALRAAGAKRQRRTGWTDYDLGMPASRPLGTELEPLGALASRTALSADSVVLARTAEVRADLEGEGTPSSEAPAAVAAATCLGDEVDAARIVPNNFTHLPNVGPDVLAFGVESRRGGATWEVFCAIDESAAEIDAAEDGMRAAFEPGASDAVTGERISSLVDETLIDRLDASGLELARARLRLAPANGPGFLFGAFVRGSLVTYVGLQPPLADAE